MKRIRVSCGEETYTASVEPSASDQFLVSKRKRALTYHSANLGFGSWEREVVVSVRSYMPVIQSEICKIQIWRKRRQLAAEFNCQQSSVVRLPFESTTFVIPIV
ncbi:hypothetical protein Tsp_12083 [Trichinella spiralis]|uniref:hypothetical protein n=1 Tax=Trichinella spiralis TaxID=6334 RepID=UPI0001EFE8C5|nr:hypothetical protein Tsp_12083 [Trichinella spiralis]